MKIKFESLRAHIPDSDLVDLWLSFFPTVERILSILDGRIKIVSGYYISDLQIELNGFDFIPNTKVLCFNLYFYEFFLDFLIYNNNPSDKSFMYVFSKYLRNFEDIDDDIFREWWRFFQYHYLLTKDSVCLNDLAHTVLKASMGTAFAILHEYFHVDESLNEAAMILIESEAFASTKFGSELSSKEKIELSCDFSALNMLLNTVPVQNLIDAQLSKEELVESALISLCINDLHSLLLHYNPLTSEEIQRERISISNDLACIIKKRFFPLIYLTQLSQNTEWTWFENIDLKKVIINASAKVLNFTQRLENIPQRYRKMFRDYNEVSIKNRPAYSSLRAKTDDQIWIHHNIV